MTEAGDLPHVLFVFMGGLERGENVFQRLWPQARAVWDEDLTLYKDFGLQRGGMAEMFAPRVWKRGIQALLKGHFVSLPGGDPWVMPGLFLIANSRVERSWDFAHAGDHPDFAKLAKGWF